MKCGLEIHQELDGKKLFCNCPTTLSEEKPDFVFTRKLRAAKGETEETDIAAQQEAQKDKTFIYEGYEHNTCLVEMDETPPHIINQEALKKVVTIARLLNCQTVDAIQVMRKTVIDGSNTSGFQRTALIGRNGWIQVDKKKVGIQTIALEEDAARIIKQTDKETTYRLDRLGIPLIEIATDASIENPEECRQAAEAIGLLLRSTKVKRGIGTIRQDINISIPGGARVEIKGTQELSMIPVICEGEIKRQQALVEIKKQLKGQYPLNIKEIKLSGTHSQLLQGKDVYGIKVDQANGIIGKETQPGKRFGTELSERAKTYGVKGIIHSDELPNYGITQEETQETRKQLECKEEDAFILVAADRQTAEKALKAVIERIREATAGVPKEVRKANLDGTTSYLRPLPGAARMYPETDVPITEIPENYITESLPETLQQKIILYQKQGLAEDLATEIAKEAPELFEDCLKTGLKPGYVAEIIISAKKQIRRQYNKEINPTDEDYKALFEAIAEAKTTKENTLEILKEGLPVKEILHKYAMLSDEQLKKEIQRIITANKGANKAQLIGIVMKELRGKATAEKIMNVIGQ